MKSILATVVLELIASFSLAQLHPVHKLNPEFKAAVNDQSKGDDKKWAIYSDTEMENKVGKLSPNDMVTVTGWSTWVYAIKTDKLQGFISWKALVKNQKTDSLSSVIRESSELDDSLDLKNRKQIRKPFSYKVKPEAYLSLSANKTEVFENECFNLSLELNIYDDNKVPLRFHDLGIQLTSIINNFEIRNSSWVFTKLVQDVNGEHKEEKRSYTNYKVLNTAFCPTIAGVINFPQVELWLEKRNRLGEFDTLINFRSNPLSVRVKSIPQSSSFNSYDHYKMCGNFSLKDFFSKETINVGVPIDYTIEVSGQGLTYPLTAPKINIPNVSVQLSSISDTDTIFQQKYLTSKTFHYQLIFTKPGYYDFNNKISFTYFDLKTSKTAIIRSQGSISVTDAKPNGAVDFTSLFYTKKNLVLIDGSQSMLIEDYSPSRLKAVTNGLKKFFNERTLCDIGLIQFAGFPQFINISLADSCYSTSLIESIKWMRSEKARGTAIGDAIFYAKNYMKETPGERKIVVVGDGDNTAGHLAPDFAAAIAKKYGIKIFTIGLGSKNPAPYRPIYSSSEVVMVENTFEDTTFKKISAITGGEYFFAKDSDDLAKILKRIFPN